MGSASITMNTSSVETGEIRYKACFHSSHEENVLGFAKIAQPNRRLWRIFLTFGIFLFLVSCQNQSDTTDYEQLFQDMIGSDISLNTEISLERLVTNLDNQGTATIIIYNHSDEDVIFPRYIQPNFYLKDRVNNKWLEIPTKVEVRTKDTRVVPAGFEELPHGYVGDYVFPISIGQLQLVPDEYARVFIEGKTAITGRTVGAYIDIKFTIPNP